MSEKITKNSGKSPELSEVAYMTAIVEASELLQRAAAPRSVKQALNYVAGLVNAELRAERRPPLSMSRIEDIWRQEARVIRAEEIDAIRKASKAAAKAEQDANHELNDLRSRVAFLEERLAKIDAHFHRESIAVARQMASDLGSLAGCADRALDRGPVTTINEEDRRP